MELEEDLDRLDALQGTLDDLDAALGRLDDGTYWRCERCGAPLGEVVAGEPLARRCPAC